MPSGFYRLYFLFKFLVQKFVSCLFLQKTDSRKFPRPLRGRYAVRTECRFW